MPRRALVATVLVLGLHANPSTGEPPPEPVPAHYVVFTIDASGVVRPQAHRRVRLAAPRPSLSEAEVEARLAASRAEDESVEVRLAGSGGEVVHRDVVSVPLWVRIEPGPGAYGPPTPVAVVPTSERAFVVRVPDVAASRLRLTLRTGEGRAGDVARRNTDFDLASLAADARLPLRQFAPRSVVTTASAASGNRVDVLVVGDGFTAAQAGAFQTAAAAVIGDFFGISPYASYRNYFLIATLFTASAQPGADHPPYDPACTTPLACCADVAGRPDNDPLSGTRVDTAFDASFCAVPSAHRNLQVNVAKVLTAAAAYPDWDEILAVVNDPTYGGSGGTVATVSRNRYAADVVRHEFGHSFTGLTDEYTTPFPGYPSCSDVGSPACEPNATDQVNRALLKWSPWVLPSTPIPTPDRPSMNGVVGLFEGARYQASGMYRPWRNCLMRTLEVGFCPVCAQAFVVKLYNGGWGTPAGGIDTIEPGSENPAPGAVSMSYPGSRTFSVGLLPPLGGPPLAVSWLVDGVPQPAATGSTFSFVPPRSGRFTVDVVVVDVTPLVHPVLRPPSFWRRRTWTVYVSPVGDLSISNHADGEARDGQGLTYTVVSSNSGPDAAAAVVTDVLPPQLTGAAWTCVATPGSSCPAGGSGNVDAPVGLAAGGSVTFTIAGIVAAGTAHQLVSVARIAGPPGFGDFDPANDTAPLTTPVFHTLGFYTVAPCRIVDTRSGDPPALGANTIRTFPTAGRCGIPATAWALSVNLTATQPTERGNLRLFPGGTPAPLASALNYSTGQTRANNAIVPLNAAGQFDVRCTQASGSVHLVVDVNGYFE